MTLGRARVMLVQTAEKGICRIRVTARGQAGHGSMPRPDSAVVTLCRALARLGDQGLPQHTTPVVESFLRQVAALQPLAERLLMPRLLNPRLSGPIMTRFMPHPGRAALMRALLQNTASPTVLRAGEVVNVIPDEAVAMLDGRTLPGQSPEDLVRELRGLLGQGLDLEVLSHAPATVNHPPDSPLWDCIRSVVRRRDRGLEVVPCMIPGFTDAQYFGRLGARWYGFAPVRIDPDSGLEFSELCHGYDERIPEDGFHWGLGALYEVVDSFCVRG